MLGALLGMAPPNKNRPTLPAEPGEPGDLLESLVVECIDAWQQGKDEAAVEAVCQRHPALADRLRARLAALRDHGIVSAPAPTQIGPYRIQSELGSGGMSVVWLAEQTEPLQRLVAVKLIKPGMDSAQILGRFASERQVLARLNHNGIAKIFDAGCTDLGHPYFVMEHVDGAPITEFCDARRMPIEARLELFARVCDAVQHAHQNGILHRDLKPSNVLVRHDDGEPVAKVIDFGLAKAMDQRFADCVQFTEVGQIVGTPEYMSPEQADPGTLDVDTRTDVYSLGVLLYELVIGCLPFDSARLRSGGLLELQRVIREEEAPRPSTRARQLGVADNSTALQHGVSSVGQLVRRVTGDLDWIAMKALAKNRERRYPSVSELAADVRRHLVYQPVQAGPPSSIYRLARFTRRHRGAVAAGAALLVTGLIGLFAFTTESRRAARHLAHFDSLSDADALATYEREARDELWPAHPDRLPAFDAWLAKARALAATVSVHEATLTEVRATADDGAQSGEFVFPHYRTQLLHGELAALVDGLHALAGEGGAIATVAARRDWAASLTERTLDTHRDAWERAVREIASTEVCPRYEGMQITPQLGLVPLGRDPHSGLYEFAHLQPGGEVPVRDRDGRLSFDADTDIVLVLLPAATPVLGVGKRKSLPNHDPYAVAHERPHYSVSLDAFFLSKYELTQGQWLRFTGENPSLFAAGSTMAPGIQLTHPVEQVSWQECDTLLGHLALEMPTEAQWEYGCRGGTDTVWWTGNRVEEIYDAIGGGPAANLADQSCRGVTTELQPGRTQLQAFDEFDDGFVYHAPVDALRPNQFGLHHVLGNVWEWCRDPNPDLASNPPRPGDGYRAASDEGSRIWRGGSFYSTAVRARCSIRLQDHMSAKRAITGVRPARPLDR